MKTDLPLKEQATEALRLAIDAAVATGQFIEEQAPLVVQELVRWQIASSVLIAVACVMFLVVWWWQGFKFCHKIDPSINDGWPWLPYFFVGGPVSLFAVPGLIAHTLNALKWIIAPRVALLEYAAELVK